MESGIHREISDGLKALKTLLFVAAAELARVKGLYSDFWAKLYYDIVLIINRKNQDMTIKLFKDSRRASSGTRECKHF